MPENKTIIKKIRKDSSTSSLSGGDHEYSNSDSDGGNSFYYDCDDDGFGKG